MPAGHQLLWSLALWTLVTLWFLAIDEWSRVTSQFQPLFAYVRVFLTTNISSNNMRWSPSVGGGDSRYRLYMNVFHILIHYSLMELWSHSAVINHVCYVFFPRVRLLFSLKMGLDNDWGKCVSLSSCCVYFTGVVSPAEFQLLGLHCFMLLLRSYCTVSFSLLPGDSTLSESSCHITLLVVTKARRLSTADGFKPPQLDEHVSN